MNAIVLELRNVSDAATGRQRGAWARNGAQPGSPDVVDIRLDAGRLAVGAGLGSPLA